MTAGVRLVLLGRQGAGKGTQCVRLSRHYVIPHISTGDMLRAAVREGTEFGRKAKEIMDRGELVSDDIVIGIVSDRIDQPDARGGFVLDGFPRTVVQAEALDTMLARKGMKLDAVIQLKVDETALLQRIESRVAEMLACGKAVRADDNPEALKIRLDAYNRQTAPLVEYYGGRGALQVVDGMAAIDEVAAAIDRVLDPGRTSTA